MDLDFFPRKGQQYVKTWMEKHCKVVVVPTTSPIDTGSLVSEFSRFAARFQTENAGNGKEFLVRRNPSI